MDQDRRHHRRRQQRRHGVTTTARLVGVPTQAAVQQRREAVADCRRVQDTNGDGQIDEDDTCIPIGGFINALRPVNLASRTDRARRRRRQPRPGSRDDPRQPGWPVSEGVQIAGTIVDADTGKPISGALFVVLNEGVTWDDFDGQRRPGARGREDRSQRPVRDDRSISSAARPTAWAGAPRAIRRSSRTVWRSPKTRPTWWRRSSSCRRTDPPAAGRITRGSATGLRSPVYFPHGIQKLVYNRARSVRNSEALAVSHLSGRDGGSYPEGRMDSRCLPISADVSCSWLSRS